MATPAEVVSCGEEVSSQPDWEDEDAEIGSVSKEDLFNLRQLSVVMRTDSEEDDNEVEVLKPAREDKRDEETRSQAEDISMETSNKTKFAINNSVVGLVNNINRINVSSYCDFIERNFPINEEDWKELKKEILEVASNGPKIHLKIVGGEIDQKERKRDGLTLVAFIKDNFTEASVSGEIQGNIVRVGDKAVFQLEGNLQLPARQGCVLRIEVRKVNGDAVGSTDISLGDIKTVEEKYYPVLKHHRKISLSSKQENLGQILLNIRKDFSEENPNISVPNILKDYFIKRLNQVLKKDDNQINSTLISDVSYTVTASHTAVGSHHNPYQRLITQAGCEGEGEMDQNKFPVTCILTDVLELGLEPRSPQSLGGATDRRLSTHRLTSTQSMLSLLSGGRERIPSPHRMLENMMDPLTSRPMPKPVKLSSISVMSTLHQHKPTHCTISGEAQVSWDLQLAVTSKVLFSRDELGNIHKYFILKTIEEVSAEEFVGKMTKTDESIMRILTGFIAATWSEVQQMISHSFISSYNNLPFNKELISNHVKTFAKSERKTEAVDCFIKSLTNKIEDPTDFDDLVFAVKNLTVLKDTNMLVEHVVVSVEKWIEKSFSTSKKTMAEPKLASCRDFLISQVYKELVKVEKKNYQALFAGLLDYGLVSGDKYLSLSKDLLRSYLPVNPGLPLKYSEKKTEVNDLRIALDTFQTLKKMWKVVHPEEDTAQWIFDLYHQFPVKWISLATMKAGVFFKNLEKRLQKDIDKFRAPAQTEGFTRSISQEENNVINETLQVIYGTIEACWIVRDDLGWRDPEVNLTTGNILIKDLNRFESSILRLVEDIHLKDQKYEAHELTAWIEFLEGLLKRHEVTITEISKLRSEVEDNSKVTSCIGEIDDIRKNLNDKIYEKIQFYVEGMRKPMRKLINDKQLINEEDNQMTLMKCLDDECRDICKKLEKSSSNVHYSHAIHELWNMVEEEILLELKHKMERNVTKNKPERFNLLKKTIEHLIDLKKLMKDNTVINDLELYRLDKMLAEVLVLSEQTSTLISKVFRRKADATMRNMEDSLNKVELDCIKLKFKLAVWAEKVVLRLVHVAQVPSREKGKVTNIQLRARLITDNPLEPPVLRSSEVLKDINTSFIFDLQAEAPTVFQFCLDEISEQSSDAFIAINIFHVDRANRKLCLGETVIQLKKESCLVQEFPRINTAEDIVNVDGWTYSMLDDYDVYDSKEYDQLSKRTETSAKQIIEKDREHRTKSFKF